LNWLKLTSGGGGGSRTHVRKTYVQSYYTVSLLINLTDVLYSRQDSRSAVPEFRTAYRAYAILSGSKWRSLPTTDISVGNAC